MGKVDGMCTGVGGVVCVDGVVVSEELDEVEEDEEVVACDEEKEIVDVGI